MQGAEIPNLLLFGSKVDRMRKGQGKVGVRGAGQQIPEEPAGERRGGFVQEKNHCLYQNLISSIKQLMGEKLVVAYFGPNVQASYGCLYVLLARKCMGADGARKGDRDRVRHPTLRQKGQWSTHGQGAAGTDRKYHGKWVTVGGKTLEGSTVFEGILKEAKEEFGVYMPIHEFKKLPFELLDDNTNNLACKISWTDLGKIFPHLNRSRDYQCNKALVFGSDGETAELRLVALHDFYEKTTKNFKYDVNCRNGLTKYVENSFKNYYIPYFEGKGLI